MEFLQKYLEIVDQNIQENEFKKEPQSLYDPMNYILNLGGKRLRPVMVLMACDAFDGDLRNAIKPALAIEFFHNFTLMHDDIMDSAPLRRGKPTVHSEFGINSAILSGDALLVKAYRYFEELEPNLYKTCTQLFSRMALTLCEGQELDMNFEHEQEVTYEQYIEMITNKTGVLGATAFRIGALIAGANYNQAKALYNFGLNVGIAFQLKDDYLDVFGDMSKFGKQQAGDIIENKKTILYILALQNASEEEQRELHYWYSMKTENVDKIYGVEKIFNHTKVNKKCLKLIEEYNQKAQSFLQDLELPEEKLQPFKDLANYLLERES